MAEKRTVVIHNLSASNDVLDDEGWDNVYVVVAIDHDKMEVVAADVSEWSLMDRLRADGYRYLHEDDVYEYNNGWHRTQPVEDKNQDA